MGYVFIYFYGLERRIVVDKKDHEAIIHEVLRLLSIYGANRSFQRYASALIWFALLSDPAVLNRSSELIDRIVHTTNYWNEERLGSLLALRMLRGEPLSARDAFIVAQHSPQSPRSVVIRRHETRFRELFNTRYAARFSAGLQLRTFGRSLSCPYHPASGTLLRSGYKGNASSLNLPNVLGLASQFEPIFELWSESIEELRDFDRASQKSAGSGLTAEMYESLPPELRTEDHPHYADWYRTIKRFTDQSGWVLVPIGELAAIRGIDERKKLTKLQSADLVNAAECMDLCLEPDTRESGQSYAWEELVSVFPRETEGAENLKSYHAASILLRLGMVIASADDKIDTQELAVITEHLNRQFSLSAQESLRLGHLAHVLTKAPRDDALLAKKLREMPKEHRLVVGEFLIGVAAADESISADEFKALKKLYRNLDLDAELLEKLSIGEVQVADQESDREEVELILDHDRIRAIMEQTAQVAEFLQTVMVDDNESPSSHSSKQSATQLAESKSARAPMSTATITPMMESQTYSGLSQRYHGFLTALLVQEYWPRDEFDAVARKHSLMPGGAVETINEWAQTELGNWLIDDTVEPIHVSRYLIQSHGEV